MDVMPNQSLSPGAIIFFQRIYAMVQDAQDVSPEDVTSALVAMLNLAVNGVPTLYMYPEKISEEDVEWIKARFRDGAIDQITVITDGGMDDAAERS